MKRARKHGIRLDDGRVVAFPYMPRVADLPPGWRHFSAAQKIEHLIGLDRCYEVLSWGLITELDPLRRSFQMQVMRVLLPIGIKAALDGSLDRELERDRTGPQRSTSSNASSGRTSWTPSCAKYPKRRGKGARGTGKIGRSREWCQKIPGPLANRARFLEKCGTSALVTYSAIATRFD